MVGGVFLSANQNTSQFEPQAAITETKRIWAISRVWYWFSDGTIFSVGTRKSDGTGYTTYSMTQDINNVDTDGGAFSGNFSIAYYVDVPTDVAQVEFFRQNPNQNAADRYNYTGFSNYSIGMKYVYEDNGIKVSTHASFSFSTTKIVSDYAAELDKSAGVCSAGAAQTAVDDYNLLATFEQNQFDALNVGGGVTGLQRLQYLKDFYNISTALN